MVNSRCAVLTEYGQGNSVDGDGAVADWSQHHWDEDFQDLDPADRGIYLVVGSGIPFSQFEGKRHHWCLTRLLNLALGLKHVIVMGIRIHQLKMKHSQWGNSSYYSKKNSFDQIIYELHNITETLLFSQPGCHAAHLYSKFVGLL